MYFFIHSFHFIHAIPFHVLSYHFMPFSLDVISFIHSFIYSIHFIHSFIHSFMHVMPCHVMSCHFIPFHFISFHFIFFIHSFMSCHVMSCHVMPCHVMSCHFISSHFVSFHSFIPLISLIRLFIGMQWGAFKVILGELPTRRHVWRENSKIKLARPVGISEISGMHSAWR